MPKQKIEEAGSLSKYERQKLQRLYTQGAAAYGSVRNLTKASRLPVSKVRQFLHSKDSYTKFTLAARKFKRMRVFARFRNETWCMDLAYVDKLAKEDNGVKFLLVRQDLFDRTVNAKGMETKDSQETVKAFSTIITKKNRPKRFGLKREPNLLERLKSFAPISGAANSNMSAPMRFAAGTTYLRKKRIAVLPKTCASAPNPLPLW